MGRSLDDPTDDAGEAAERFFAALQASPPGCASASADALREALLAQHRILREAEGATADALTDDEHRRMENVRLMLVNQGALPSPSAVKLSSKATSLLARAWSAWRLALRGSGTPARGRGLAYAIALVVCTVLVVPLLPDHREAEEDVLRGQDAVVNQVDDPAGSAARLSQALRAAGAEVVAAPLNDDAWVVEIDVPASSRAQVEAVAKAHALQLSGHGPFLVKLQRR